MTPTPLALLCGLVAAMPVAAVAQTDVPQQQGVPQGQGSDPSTGLSPPAVAPDAGLLGAPATPAPQPQAAVPAAAPQPDAAAPPTPVKNAAKPVPTATGALRNGSVPRPASALPNGGVQQPGTSTSVTYGGPQQDLQPVYGSPMRDAGSARNGGPVYSNGPSRPGGPINGTANAYLPTQPYGTSRRGSGTPAPRGGASDPGSTANLKPLGGVPTTRDQGGTYGGQAGYNASGVYNGTAAQTGYGYGSPYAPSGRPQGGLLSTNVDATGPLRPYVPLNQSPTGRPNSGYGIPNGSRSTHIDGRGVQRID